MAQYTLLTYLTPGAEPSPAEVGAAWQAFHKEITESGVLLANSGLAGTDAATTVRVKDGEPQLTDGPFADTKEYLAGFFLIEAADLDEALSWAAKIPNAAYGPVEVRPAWGK
ncbi:YciI family protein [Streptomyces sp. NPDC051940]|uniref:YciI family protein n=1 Tax=Streptomyces sp. NPDC051940 TaxID=3155675 RepID=UPI00343C17A8